MAIPSPVKNPKLWDSMKIGRFSLSPPLFVVRLSTSYVAWDTTDNKGVGSSGGIPTRKGTQVGRFQAEILLPDDNLNKAWPILEQMLKEFNPEKDPNNVPILDVYHPRLALLRITKATIDKIELPPLTPDLMVRAIFHFKTSQKKVTKSSKPKQGKPLSLESRPNVYTKKDTTTQPKDKKRP